MSYLFGSISREQEHEHCWRTRDAMGISRDLTPLTWAPQPAAWGWRAPTWLPTRVGTEVLLAVHPRTSGFFLSISKSGSRVIAKCFPTLPLRYFPFQHRGKYRVHNFNEYFLNDWMFMLGICRGTGYTTLYFQSLLLVTVFPLWPHFFPRSPLFAGDTVQ